jgi:hypothetical protein
MHKLSHNKKRNLGLVYEFLSREVTNSVIAKDKKRTAATLSIMSSFLSEGAVLHQELSMHRQVMETRGVSERLAKRIVDELKAAGIKSSSQKTLHEKTKSDLIHEINKTLGQDLFDRYRIPNYTAHASVNILMSRGLGGRIDEGVELARVEDHLLEFLTTMPTESAKYDPDASLYAYKTAIGLFEQEYGKLLSVDQSNLLKEYIKVSLGGNVAPFERMFQKQCQNLREVLRDHKVEDVFKSDTEMAKRLDEAIADLDNLKVEPTDDSVERLMLYHNLKMEIES